ncbi:uncharacterized protein V1510DRAFT_430347 [Dipodascopsis tothii]|uniref:uncharacterized protein n=1 Tax=Dipodascopsis tothii TaxID=44089 RepID=UPI0034CFE5F5
MAEAAAGAPAGAQGDDVQQIYYYYEVAKGFTGVTKEQMLEAYKQILTFAAPAKDSKARTLASSFIPDLFKDFAVEDTATGTKAVESMFDLCEDEDLRLRTGAIKRLPDMLPVAIPADQETIVNILIQLLQAQAPAELQIVQGALERACKALPEIAARQLWEQTYSESPALREIALNWAVAQGKQHLAKEPAYATAAVKALGQLSDAKALSRVLSVVMALPAYKAGDDNTARLTELGDLVVGKLAAGFDPAAEATKELIAFVPKWIVNVLNRNGSPASLFAFLNATALPAISQGKLTDARERMHLLRLAVEGCVSKQADAEIDTFLPLIKDTVATLYHDIEQGQAGSEPYSCDWPSIEPAVVGLYIGVHKRPEYAVPLDGESEFGPALKKIFYEAQVTLPTLRKQETDQEKLLHPDPAVLKTIGRVRQQCTNVIEVVKELLKPAGTRSKVPPPIKFSWRPANNPPKGAKKQKQKPPAKPPAPAPAPVAPAAGQTGQTKVNLKRPATDAPDATPDKKTKTAAARGKARTRGGRAKAAK